MQPIDITELRSHLPDYIARAEAGEQILIARRGQVIIRLTAARDPGATARQQLQCLRATATVGDVVSPTGARWGVGG